MKVVGGHILEGGVGMGKAGLGWEGGVRMVKTRLGWREAKVRMERRQG